MNCGRSHEVMPLQIKPKFEIIDTPLVFSPLIYLFLKSNQFEIKPCQIACDCFTIITDSKVK